MADRMADWIGGFSGSVTFVFLHMVIYGFWILINLKLIPGIRAFDPYPFLLLSVVVSIEAIFLSTFVLMKQNRMSPGRPARPSGPANQSAGRAGDDQCPATSAAHLGASWRARLRGAH